MDSDSGESDFSASESDVDGDDPTPNQPTTSTGSSSTARRFSVAQRTCLNSYFISGMTGTGKHYSSLISRAAADTNLRFDQVKVSHNIKAM